MYNKSTRVCKFAQQSINDGFGEVSFPKFISTDEKINTARKNKELLVDQIKKKSLLKLKCSYIMDETQLAMQH